MTTPRLRLLDFVTAAAVAALMLLSTVSAASAATPSISIPLGMQRYFSPNGDGQEDTATVYYCLAEAANVTITVADRTGDVIRTLEDGVSHSGGGCSSSLPTAMAR